MQAIAWKTYLLVWREICEETSKGQAPVLCPLLVVRELHAPAALKMGPMSLSLKMQARWLCDLCEISLSPFFIKQNTSLLIPDHFRRPGGGSE
jgi:hypothetical protein